MNSSDIGTLIKEIHDLENRAAHQRDQTINLLKKLRRTLEQGDKLTTLDIIDEELESSGAI